MGMNRNIHGKIAAFVPGITVQIDGQFAVGAAGAVGAISDCNAAVSSIVRNSAGDYTITLKDSYAGITWADAQVVKAAAADLKAQIKAIGASNNSVEFVFLAVAAPTDPANGDTVFFTIRARQLSRTSVPN